MPGLPIDHLVFATLDLDATAADLEARTGVRAAPGGSHVGRGTRNQLLSLAADGTAGPYLELIGPDPDQGEPVGPRPFGLDDVTASRLVGFAVTSDDLATVVAASRAAGYDPGEVAAMSRATPDGGLLQWELTPGPGFDGLVPFVIDWKGTPHPSTTNPRGATLVSLRGEHPDPDGVRLALAALGVDIEVTQGATPALVAELDTPNGRITLT